MNRLWLGCNVVLTLVLVVCLIAQIEPEPAQAATVDGDPIAFTAAELFVDQVGVRDAPRLRLSFGEAMVAPSEVGGAGPSVRL